MAEMDHQESAGEQAAQRAGTGRLFRAKALRPENPSSSFVRKLRDNGADGRLIAAVEGRKR